MEYESHYLSVPEQQHLAPEYLAINPDGQVPTLIHDGEVSTETTIINEYLDDAFPDPPLRPSAPAERARMRRWGQIVDETLFPAVATLAWHYGIGPILRTKDHTDIDRALERLPLQSKRQKWLKASRTGFSQSDLDEARSKITYGIERMERTLAEFRYLAGSSFSLADINVLSSVQRMPRWAPDLMNEKASPRTFAWLQTMMERPAFPPEVETSRNRRIDMASSSLPKSPVSSSSGDAVPHMFIRKSRLQLGNFVISDAKRLLQHNREKSGRAVREQRTSAFDPDFRRAKSLFRVWGC